MITIILEPRQTMLNLEKTVESTTPAYCTDLPRISDDFLLHRMGDTVSEKNRRKSSVNQHIRPSRYDSTAFSRLNNILIYGGSFDPIHLGHLKTAIAVQNDFQFKHFIFLPCKTPVLKKATTASCEQRIQMLKLALEPYPAFKIDLREIQRGTPSFMVNTLQSFRDELGEQLSITLLLGMDAFLQLPQWHAWKKIPSLANLLVMARAQLKEKTVPEQLSMLLKNNTITDKMDLLNYPNGKIYQYNAGNYGISSRCLRQKIKEEKDIRPYLPDAVYQYIKSHQIYIN